MKVVPNAKIIVTPKVKALHSSFSVCKEKSGLLNHLKSAKKFNLIVSPVFIRITPRQINFFNSFEKGSLFKSLNLNEIIRITQQYTNTNCFDIETRVNTNSVVEKTTLCSISKKMPNNWINAILEFKKCKIIVNPVEIKNKLNIESRNMNTVHEEQLASLHYPNKGNIKTVQQQQQVASLNYDNKGVVFKPSRESVLKKNLINNNMKKLLITMKKGQAAERAVKRVMIGKLINVKTVSQSVIKQEEEIRQALEKKSIFENEKQRRLVKMESKHKEIMLIKKAEKKLREEKVFY